MLPRPVAAGEQAKPFVSPLPSCKQERRAQARRSRRAARFGGAWRLASLYGGGPVAAPEVTSWMRTGKRSRTSTCPPSSARSSRESVGCRQQLPGERDVKGVELHGPDVALPDLLASAVAQGDGKPLGRQLASRVEDQRQRRFIRLECNLLDLGAGSSFLVRRSEIDDLSIGQRGRRPAGARKRYDPSRRTDHRQEQRGRQGGRHPPALPAGSRNDGDGNRCRNRRLGKHRFLPCLEVIPRAVELFLGLFLSRVQAGDLAKCQDEVGVFPAPGEMGRDRFHLLGQSPPRQ